jgi:hypothetical protein
MVDGGVHHAHWHKYCSSRGVTGGRYGSFGNGRRGRIGILHRSVIGSFGNDGSDCNDADKEDLRFVWLPRSL